MTILMTVGMAASYLAMAVEKGAATKAETKAETTAATRKPTPVPLVLLALAGGVLLSPILIPIAAWQTRRTSARLSAAALRFACERCGQLLAQASVDRAHTERQAMIEKLQLENPGVIFRLARAIDATCVSCGQEYYFDEAGDTFTPLRGRRQRLSPAPENSAESTTLPSFEAPR